MVTQLLQAIKSILKILLPKTAIAYLQKVIAFLRMLYPLGNLSETISFLAVENIKIGLYPKLRILWRVHLIGIYVDSPHTNQEILTFISHILTIPKERKGVIVEAGCFKGSSSAKFSLAALIVGRELVIFDSFKGIPKNDEPHERNIFGGKAKFAEGDYHGSLEEVKSNIAKFGSVKSCRFIEGFFEDTMPLFNESICAAYVDVDLVSSTRTCLKYLFPLLEQDCSMFSQDGHLPLVIDLLDDNDFWESELGIAKPQISGLRKQKLVEIPKR